jgi:hypothetical protein
MQCKIVNLKIQNHRRGSGSASEELFGFLLQKGSSYRVE